MARRIKGFSHHDDVVHTRQRGISGPPGNTGKGKLQVGTKTSLDERVRDLMDGDLENLEALQEDDIE